MHNPTYPLRVRTGSGVKTKESRGHTRRCATRRNFLSTHHFLQGMLSICVKHPGGSVCSLVCVKRPLSAPILKNIYDMNIRKHSYPDPIFSNLGVNYQLLYG